MRMRSFAFTQPVSPRISQTPLRRFLLASIVAAVGVLLCASAVQAGEFDIPAQPLPDALKVFSQQSGLQFMFLTETIQNRQSTPVAGELPAVDALRRMLKGTGLEFEFTSEDTVTIKSRLGNPGKSTILQEDSPIAESLQPERTRS